MSHNRETAKRLLVHYFYICFRLAGVRFDSDNRAEVETIVDAIFDEIQDNEEASAEREALRERRKRGSVWP